jgi:hypothetical protein
MTKPARRSRSTGPVLEAGYVVDGARTAIGGAVTQAMQN